MTKDGYLEPHELEYLAKQRWAKPTNLLDCPFSSVTYHKLIPGAEDLGPIKVTYDKYDSENGDFIQIRRLT